jgi:hypothetical protein
MTSMSRLWWLPYTTFALLGAPAISLALTAVVAAYAFGPLYLVVTLGIPVALVVAVMVERRSRAVFVAVLAVAALAMCLAAQLAAWSGVS